MATNDQMNSSGHPEDLLEAFALNALELDEEELVQDHLDACDRCSVVVSEYLRVAAVFGEAVPQLEPSSGLRGQLMQAVSRAEPKAEQAPQPQVVPSVGGGLADSRLVRMLMPMAASVAVILVVLALAMNVRISGQIDDLESENADLRASLDSSVATVTAQMSSAANAETEVMDTVLDLQQASYELAQPDNMSLELTPPSSTSRSQGILLVSSDGNRGVIMLAGMDPPNTATDYHVWLMRGEDKMWAGQVGVDSRGWGTVALSLPESIMKFDKVALTMGAESNASQPQTDMVLQGNLVSMNAPRKVTFASCC